MPANDVFVLDLESPSHSLGPINYFIELRSVFLVATGIGNVESPVCKQAPVPRGSLRAKSRGQSVKDCKDRQGSRGSVEHSRMTNLRFRVEQGPRLHAHPLDTFSAPISFPDGRVKRDLLHSSFGAKYAPRQTPWPALERNPMHFIRGRVIQSDGSLVIRGVYSGTPPLLYGSPVAPLWTQSNPEDLRNLPLKRPVLSSFVLPASNAHFLCSGQPSGYTDRQP